MRLLDAGRPKGRRSRRRRLAATAAALTALATTGAARVSSASAGPLTSAPEVVAAASVHAGSCVGPDGLGYWQVASDGGVFAYGTAGFYGSMGGMHLNQPVVGMAPSVDGRGYWLVASDGGVFAFGDAPFEGSTGNLHLNAPVVGMVPTVDGQGYWLVAADGGVFSFGDAVFYGSTGGIHLNKPDRRASPPPRTAGATGWWHPTAGCSASATPSSTARWAASTSNQPVVGIAATRNANGYQLTASDGGRVQLRRRRSSTARWAACTSTSRWSASAARSSATGTRCRPPTAGSSTSATRPSAGRPGPSGSTSPSSAWRSSDDTDPSVRSATSTLNKEHRMTDVTRRQFLRNASIGAAAAGVLAVGRHRHRLGAIGSRRAPPWRCRPAEEPTTLDGSDVFARVVDAKAGQIKIFVGTKAVDYTNQALAQQLLRAAQ